MSIGYAESALASESPAEADKAGRGAHLFQSQLFDWSDGGGGIASQRSRQLRAFDGEDCGGDPSGAERDVVVATAGDGSAATIWASSARLGLASQIQGGFAADLELGEEFGAETDVVAPVLARDAGGALAALWIDPATQAVNVARGRRVSGGGCVRPVVPPTIEGAPEEDALLQAGTGRWESNRDIGFAYQWRRCSTGGSDCADVPNATGPQYRLTAPDVARRIVVRVTGANEGGARSADSAATGVVTGDGEPPAGPGSGDGERPRAGARAGVDPIAVRRVRLARLGRRSLGLTLSCADRSPAPCRGRVAAAATVRLRAGRRRVILGSRRLRMPPGRNRRLAFRVSPRRQRLLRRGRPTIVRLTVILRQADGRITQARFRLRLRAGRR